MSEPIEPTPIDPLTGLPYLTLQDALAAPRKLLVDPAHGPFFTIQEAVKSAVAGNTILLASGQHDNYDCNQFPDGVNFVGYEGWSTQAGPPSVIRNYHLGATSNMSIALVPGRNSYFGYFRGDSISSDPRRFQAIIGAAMPEGHRPFQRTRWQRIIGSGQTDVLFLSHNVVCSAWVDWFDFLGAWDGVAIRDYSIPTMHQLTFNHCLMSAAGPSSYQPLLTDARAVVIDAGLTRIYNSTLRASGATGAGNNLGLYLLDLGRATTDVHLENCILEATIPWLASPNTVLWIDGVKVYPTPTPEPEPMPVLTIAVGTDKSQYRKREKILLTAVTEPGAQIIGSLSVPNTQIIGIDAQVPSGVFTSTFLVKPQWGKGVATFSLTAKKLNWLDSETKKLSVRLI